MSRPPFHAGLPFGCLGAALLGFAMAFVILVGTIMGDCDPGPGCHDQDGFLIARSLLLAAPIVFVAGAAVTMLAAVAHCWLSARLDRAIVKGILSIGTVIVICLGFKGAFALFMGLRHAAGL